MSEELENKIIDPDEDSEEEEENEENQQDNGMYTLLNFI